MRYLRPARLTGTACLLALAVARPADAAPEEFASAIRPVLAEHCSACHNPENPKNTAPFLRSRSAKDVSAQRGLWRNVAVQLRNRTMPPTENALSEHDRFRVAAWIQEQLRETACQAGEFAGAVTARRLNRREYRNTVRDLFGVDFEVSEIFPADGSGGEGFDTHSETLYLPPLLMERYIEAAQRILDRAVVTPALIETHGAEKMQPAGPLRENATRLMAIGDQLTAMISVYVEDDYELRVSIERPSETEARIALKVDGIETEELVYPADPNGGATGRTATVRLGRGVHAISVQVGDRVPVELFSVKATQKAGEPSAEKRFVHYRLFRSEPGEPPLTPRKSARALLARVLPQAYRRPVAPAEVDRLMALYDRSADRGDPYEERVKLALKAVLVSSDFLFRAEQEPSTEGIHRIGDHELATRLSYFLWSTMPDGELTQLAAAGRLQQDEVLAAQVDRMLDDPRSRVFAGTFVGQWLGTQDVGGRIAPTVNAVQHYYTPEVAAAMREEPVLLFHSILVQDRSLLEFLDSDYAYLNQRLAEFYQVEEQYPQVQGDDFQRVDWADARRGGVLGLGAVLAMTSHFKQTSPVLRGAWVLDTLLGTPVPTPPPDIPPLEIEDNDESGLTVRQRLMRHRADPSCSACHDLIDPIGFGLENFDWLGRWRDQEDNGEAIDSAGVMPSGEVFDGPAELRRVLMSKKDEYLRHLSGKVLGYALGRALEDADQCLIQRLVDDLGRSGFRARTLVKGVVLSEPFRSRQRQTPPGPGE